MKKITCFINNSKILEKIEEFCTSERFTCEPITSVADFEYDAATVLYITDISTEIYFDGLKDIPVCYIGSEKIDNKSIFVLRENFTHINLRCLIDAVTHSGCYESHTAAVEPICLNKLFSISNDIFNIDKIVFSLTKDFVYFMDFGSLEKVRVGLSEMLTNAIEHGNMGIRRRQDGSYRKWNLLRSHRSETC